MQLLFNCIQWYDWAPFGVLLLSTMSILFQRCTCWNVVDRHQDLFTRSATFTYCYHLHTNYSLNHYIHSIKYLLNTIDSSNLLTRISLHLEVFLSVWPIRSSGKIQPCLFNQCRSPRMDISIHPHQLHPKEMHHQQHWESNLKELSQPKALIRLKPLLAPLIASIHQSPQKKTTRRQLLLLSRQRLSKRSRGTSFPKMRRNIYMKMKETMAM